MKIEKVPPSGVARSCDYCHQVESLYRLCDRRETPIFDLCRACLADLHDGITNLFVNERIAADKAKRGAR